MSHIVLRIKQPELERPYKTPGGMFTSGISLVLSLIAMTGVYAFDPSAFFMTMGLFLIGGVYYGLYSRNKLVASSAEEEFAMLSLAEQDLNANTN
ncbi:hypothetical protein LRP52_43060 [Photobacterium sp. ZSDE20]|uniref:Uncharacterized protein n=1 Tax=Photobacterium pectinilyticum TaxID=2906793 RepID=A0ABT1N4X6_9GAMM|nr:hypothetical protein [Photobacterium sp. ZSDE20]MDD1828953.1 hypothetical protein [Photobacterium sp. ZSDE20]